MSELAILREFSSRGDAEVVRELLIAHGIDAVVTSDDCGAVDPALAFVRGVRLLVPADDLELAEQAIAAGLQGIGEDDDIGLPTERGDAD